MVCLGETPVTILGKCYLLRRQFILGLCCASAVGGEEVVGAEMGH